MACKLYLGNLTFDSELALDEYLVNNAKFIEKYGDQVFSMNSIQNLTREILMRSDKEKDRLYKEGKLKRKATITDYSESYYEAEKPYRGVNSFLNLYTFKDSQGIEHPLSPVFDLDSFISNKSKDWKDMEYWQTVASEEEIRDIFGDNEPYPITTKDELERIKEMYVLKWLYQSILGSAVHDAMNAWWRAKPSDKKDQATFVAYLKNRLKGKVREDSKRTYEEVIPENIWDLIAEHCFKIEKELKSKFGSDSVFLSEVGLTSTVIEKDGKTSPFIGVADLIVIDSLGNVQVLDYKTSPKVYGDYNSAKKRSFHYLLAVYRRMIQRLGINVGSDSGVFVIPMQFENFRYNLEKDSATFDNLISEAYDPSSESNTFSYLEELPILVGENAGGIRKHLDEFIPLSRVSDTRSEDISQKLEDFTKKCFPSYSDKMELTDEKVVERIKRLNNFKKDPTTNNYSYKLGKDLIERKTPEALVAAVKTQLLEIKNLTLDTTLGVKRLIKQAQKTGIINFNVGKTYTVGKYASEQWLSNQLSRYATKDWNILEGPAILEDLGVILLENVWTHQVNVIKISNTTWEHLEDEVLLGGTKEDDKTRNTRHTLTGFFESDLVQKQRPKSLVLDSNYGNIELMQTMHILDMLPKFFSDNSRIVGDIQVMNVRHLQALSTTNKQLLYNYKELQRLSNKKYKEDIKTNFDDTIHCASLVESVKTLFKEIINGLDNNDIIHKDSRWADFKNCTNALDNYASNPIKLRAKLIDLANKLEEAFNLTKVENTSYSEIEHPERKLYYTIHMAIAEIDGVDFTQQTRDHDLWMEHGKFWIKGLSGTLFDNPGNMSSETLNSVSKQVYVAYLNVRNDMSKLNSELRNKLNALKRDKNYNWLEARTIGNQTDLYKNMFDYSIKDDLRFVNPWDPKVLNNLSKAEIEFLQFVLYRINGNRFGLSTEEQFLNKLKEDPDEFLAVPLTVGSFASQVSMKGMLQTLKDKFSGILPSQIKTTVREKLEGYLLEDESVKKARSGEMWSMMNKFDAGDDFNNGGRQKVISENLREHPELGLNFFEHNLEVLCLKHEFAYSLKDHLDKVFPTIKAAMLHLSMLGIIKNDRFEDDIQYLNDFIKNKIFNLSIQDEKWLGMSYVINNVMSAASKMALAFNPRQLYLALDGIWKDISLVIRKPDGETSFTSDNMKDSFFWIYKDLMHFGDEKSMAELFNELYGLNDMDMNSLVEKISSDNVGIWNFWNIAFRFASRPDFYNRLTIFGALMRGDGCFEAHSVKNGKLIYDMSKDKRFDLFAQGKDARQKDPEKYDKLKALYIAMARLFMAEHATDDNGKEFVLDLSKDKPQTLPRAYTTKLSESMKSLSDLIYGYYSHEKKALVQSTTLGALFMQMNTYWSSKKNQWLAPGGIKQMGRMELYEEIDPDLIDPETGKPKVIKYWLKLDEDGNPTNIPTTEDTGVPFMLWKGLYQEGIVVTVMNMIKDLYLGDVESGERSLSGTINNYWNNEDLNLLRAYRNNLKLLLYDLFMLLFLGMLVTPALMSATKEHIKDFGNDDFSKAMVNNCTYNLVNMLDSSTDDFNMFNSLFGKGMQWTPFAISSMQRTFSNISNMITGDRDLFDTAVNMASVTRSQEPIWDFVKMSTLGREIGDNGEA